jgi:hypothetical protein
MQTMASQGLKRSVAAAAAAIMVGGVSLGIVNAQGGQNPNEAPGHGPRHGITRQGPNGQQGHEQFLTTLAGKLGVSVDTLRQAMSAARSELGMQGGPGGWRGQGDVHRPERPGGERGGMMMHAGLDTVANAIGITVDQLRSELPGKSLAQVANAHNVSTDTLISALKTAANSRIDQAVSAGRITSDQANQMKQNLDQRISNMVNRTTPAAGQWMGPKGPGHRGPQQ